MTPIHHKWQKQGSERRDVLAQDTQKVHRKLKASPTSAPTSPQSTGQHPSHQRQAVSTASSQACAGGNADPTSPLGL